MYGILILCVLVNVYKIIYILNYDMFVVDFCVDFVFGDVFGVEVFGGVVDGDFFVGMVCSCIKYLFFILISLCFFIRWLVNCFWFLYVFR